MPDEHPEKFPKSSRVFRQRDFDRVFKSGRVIADSVLVIHSSANGQDRWRLGISISRKVGNAVLRNYWKRLIREAFRRERINAPVFFDLVVRPRKGAVPDGPAIRRSLANCMRKLSRA
jgi:ribonuclease P protein component